MNYSATGSVQPLPGASFRAAVGLFCLHAEPGDLGRSAPWDPLGAMHVFAFCVFFLILVALRSGHVLFKFLGKKISNQDTSCEVWDSVSHGDHELLWESMERGP